MFDFPQCLEPHFVFTVSKALGFLLLFVKAERVGGNSSSMATGGRGNHKRPEERKEREREINMSFGALQGPFKT